MQTFKKSERLCSKQIIELLFKNNKTFKISTFRVTWNIIEHKGLFPAQLLISVSKRNIKMAVDRNLIKRQIREAYRKNKQLFYEGLIQSQKKIVFCIAYQGKVNQLSYLEIEDAIVKILKRINYEVAAN